MNKFLLILSFLITLTFCGCYPYTTYHLQHFSSRLLQTSGLVQIESGRKETYGETGITFTGNFGNNDISFAEGSYYENASGEVDHTKVNSFIHFPGKTIDAYGAFFTRGLVSGIIEAQFGSLGENYLYSFSSGLGVRLYKGPVAGRVFTRVGLVKIYNKVILLEANHGSTDPYGTDEPDYDLIDKYSAVKPTLGATFAFNTRFESFLFNPFITMNYRTNALFNYDFVYVGYESFSGICGFYGNVGPTALILGCKLNLYTMNNKEIFSHPELVTQITFKLF